MAARFQPFNSEHAQKLRKEIIDMVDAALVKCEREGASLTVEFEPGIPTSRMIVSLYQPQPFKMA